MFEPIGPQQPSDAHDATAVADGSREELQLVKEDLLVEDVSLDGMCGVY